VGTILARTVISKAERILQDSEGIRWPLDEMLGWLNSGQRDIVLLRPDASSATVKFQLAAGTQQKIPSTALRLLDIVRNMGPSGDAPGRAIRFIEREILDAQIPDWHSSTPSSTVKHWTVDEREPKTFYVFPPQPSSGIGQVNAVVSQSPTNCTLKDVKDENGVVGTTDSPISIDDIFEGPLIDYVRYRGLLKEAEYAGDGAKADQAYAKFMASLGFKTATDKQFAPRRSAPPYVNPNVPGNQGALGD
jgi:hypothetical protein